LIEEKGSLPEVLKIRDQAFITTTIFVKYNYTGEDDGPKLLDSITVIALPNGFPQERYNPTAEDTIWRAGRNAPTLGEAFRVRLKLNALKNKMRWRVQTIPLPPVAYEWDE
jgi:hypothetical protein